MLATKDGFLLAFYHEPENTKKSYRNFTGNCQHFTIASSWPTLYPCGFGRLIFWL